MFSPGFTGVYVSSFEQYSVCPINSDWIGPVEGTYMCILEVPQEILACS